MFTSKVLKRFSKTFGAWLSAAPPRRKPCRTVKLGLEALEERWCPAGGGGNTDTLEWFPTPGDQDAGTASNWFDLTTKKTSTVVPAASNPVIFDGSVANAPITIGPLTVKTMTLQNGYTALMTILTGGAVTDSGTFTEDGASKFNVYFGDNNTTFTIAGGGNITNMVLGGSPNPTGNLILSGGAMTIAQSDSFTETSAVNITVNQGATLKDNSWTPLNFTNSGLTLGVAGTMNVFYGANGGSTLISRNGYSNDWIYVTGTLTYLGSAGTADTIDMNVKVDQSGSFILETAAGRTDGANLTVKGDPNYVSVGLPSTAANSTVQLNESATLVCYYGYTQYAGTLETMDDSSCTLQFGPSGQPLTGDINGGTIIIDAASSGYGVLNIAGNLNFAGTLRITIQGNASGQGNCDLLTESSIRKDMGVAVGWVERSETHHAPLVGLAPLDPPYTDGSSFCRAGLSNVLGNLTLNAGSTLDVFVDGELVANNNWVIINNNSEFGPNNNFASSNLITYGLTANLNKPQDGDYQLQS